jgi:CDP-glycerol glycerophosphotransferase
MRDGSRKSVAIFAGSFLNNGITSSLKSLLARIDPERYNFFLCIDARIAEARGTKFLLQMDKRIGVIATRNWLSITPFEAVGFLARDLFSGAWGRENKAFRRIWEREHRRLFGVVQFDCVVHFTGYERRLSFLMTASTAKKIVFCHNDMLKEVTSHRVSDPRALRLAYEQADVIASVREGTIDGYSREVFDISSKNILVPNTIPLTCVQRSLAGIESALHPDTPPHVRDRMIRALGEDGKFRFINLARFSREKGQDRLISAFEEIWRACPNAQLFVLGPHGILFNEIVARANNSPARKGIFVAQGSDNPFPILAKCHASILASFYEGLPMVIFESLALGVPVISTDIPGPSEFLGQGFGMVVPNDTQGLVAGMRAAIDGHVHARHYDFDEHNAWAVSRFYAAIEAAGVEALH